METERPRRKRVSQAELDRLAEQDPARALYEFDPPAQRIERKRPESIYDIPPRSAQPEWKRRAIESAVERPAPKAKPKPKPQPKPQSRPAPRAVAYGAPAAAPARKTAARPTTRAAAKPAA